MKRELGPALSALDRVIVGVSSWADASLLASGWYPKQARTAEARLRHYATRFSLVENDMPYYALPTEEQTARWSERTPPGFTMNVKAHALLTLHYTDPKRLPPDLRETLPPEVAARPRVYPRDLDPELLREIARRFRAAVGPLRRSGRLGALLFQFPVWVPNGMEARALLVAMRGTFPEDRIAVEFRNRTWMSPDSCDDTLAFLRDHEIAYTCVDEPQGFSSSVPPIAAVTADLAYVRLHGRNAARWDRAARTARERFEYLYPEDELAEWVPAIGALSDRAERVHVVLNNCYSDYAVRNAAQLEALLRAARRVALAA